MSSAFIDTNVIVKYFAGFEEARRLLEPVLAGELEGYINVVVYSEVLFTVLRLLTGRNAYRLKGDPGLVSRVAREKLRDYFEFLEVYFHELEVTSEVKRLAFEVMRDYGLLPNDALIAATCRYYGIETVVTFDEDFERIPWLRVKRA